MTNREREKAPARAPGEAQSSTSVQPFGPDSRLFGVASEVGKRTGWEFFDRKIVPREQSDYQRFLDQDTDGQKIFKSAKEEAIRGVEQDFAAHPSPSPDPVFIQRPEPMIFKNTSIGAHQITLIVEYTVEIKGRDHLFHITMYMTATPLDRTRPKFQEQMAAYTFKHRSSGSGREAPKKWKADDGVDNLYRG